MSPVGLVPDVLGFWLLGPSPPAEAPPCRVGAFPHGSEPEPEVSSEGRFPPVAPHPPGGGEGLCPSAWNQGLGRCVGLHSRGAGWST